MILGGACGVKAHAKHSQVRRLVSVSKRFECSQEVERLGAFECEYEVRRLGVRHESECVSEECECVSKRYGTLKTAHHKGS